MYLVLNNAEKFIENKSFEKLNQGVYKQWFFFQSLMTLSI